MIGIIPSLDRTFEVVGMIDNGNLIEGKLYVDSADGRVYMFSKIEKRSSPATGYFPIWNGQEKIITKYSNMKYSNVDIVKMDVSTICNQVNGDVAEDVLNRQRRSENDQVLAPLLSNEDNMFTQCIKGVLLTKKYTLIDLVDMSRPRLPDKTILSYYHTLTKITFMRPDKWLIWLDIILHMGYELTVYKDDRRLLSYRHPDNIFDTGIVKYDDIIKTKDDPLKKIIRILTIMENINKHTLRSEEVDDYTINNMLTTLNSDKPLSAQLFSRFILMASLSYNISIHEKGKTIFTYYEST